MTAAALEKPNWKRPKPKIVDVVDDGPGGVVRARRSEVRMNTVSKVCIEGNERHDRGEEDDRRGAAAGGSWRTAPTAPGAVDARGLDDRGRNVLQAGQEDDDVQAQRGPDRHDRPRRSARAFGSPSQSGGVIPKILPDRGAEGCRRSGTSAARSWPRPRCLSTTGAKNRIRYRVLVLSFSRATAMTTAKPSPIGTVISARQQGVDDRLVAAAGPPAGR